MNQNNFLVCLPKILLDFLWDLIYAPFWWYSTGLFRLLKSLAVFLRDRQINLGIAVWVKNIFTPMYGQRDFISRLISFVIRLLQIFVRGLGLLFWLILCLAAAVLWLVLPIFAFYILVYQLVL